MIECPKCHGMKIHGPTYIGPFNSNYNHFRGEELKYICENCGYATTTPTKDNRNASNVLLGKENA